MLKELINTLELRAATHMIHVPGSFKHSATDNELNCIICIQDAAKRDYAIELLRLIEEES